MVQVRKRYDIHRFFSRAKIAKRSGDGGCLFGAASGSPVPEGSQTAHLPLEYPRFLLEFVMVNMPTTPDADETSSLPGTLQFTCGMGKYH